MLYDFANTIFSMNIATLYFTVWLVSDLRASNTMVALGNGLWNGNSQSRRVVTAVLGMLTSLALLWNVPNN
jgi:MFS-type transporter involved in bile tolerance (Atg22 family)